MKTFQGADITKEHKQEFREAREQAISGIDRLNKLYAITGRSYRARLETYTMPVPIPREIADHLATDPYDDPDHVDAPRRPGVPEDEDGI